MARGEETQFALTKPGLHKSTSACFAGIYRDQMSDPKADPSGTGPEASTPQSGFDPVATPAPSRQCPIRYPAFEPFEHPTALEPAKNPTGKIKIKTTFLGNTRPRLSSRKVKPSCWPALRRNLLSSMPTCISLLAGRWIPLRAQSGSLAQNLIDGFPWYME